MVHRALILYVPVVHQGYLDLVEEALRREVDVYILADDFVNIREIRSVSADTAVRLLRSFFASDHINLLGTNLYDVINSYDVFELANDDAVREFAQCIPDDKEIVETSTFLRWDATSVFSQTDVSYDRISTDPTDIERIALAESAATDAGDWWRQVGVVLIDSHGFMIVSRNRHLPTEHTVYIDGDPRDVIAAGTYSELSTALHAEQDGICQAVRLGKSLEGASIYLTVYPCPVCAKLIAACGIKAVYFASGHASLDGEAVLRAAGVELIYVKTPS